MPMEEYDDLLIAAKAFPDDMKKHFLFISRSGFTSPVQQRAAREGAVLLTLKDLFEF